MVQKYGVPLRSKYPDSEMSFQKQKIRLPKKKIRLPKKKFEVEILSRDCERTLTSDIEDSYGLTGLHDSGIRGLVFSPSL